MATSANKTARKEANTWIQIRNIKFLFYIFCSSGTFQDQCMDIRVGNQAPQSCSLWLPSVSWQQMLKNFSRVTISGELLLNTINIDLVTHKMTWGPKKLKTMRKPSKTSGDQVWYSANVQWLWRWEAWLTTFIPGPAWFPRLGNTAPVFPTWSPIQLSNLLQQAFTSANGLEATSPLCANRTPWKLKSSFLL